MGKYLRRLNAAKIGAIITAIGTVIVDRDNPHVWSLAIGTILAAVSGDKNSEADEERRKAESRGGL